MSSFENPGRIEHFHLGKPSSESLLNAIQRTPQLSNKFWPFFFNKALWLPHKDIFLSFSVQERCFDIHLMDLKNSSSNQRKKFAKCRTFEHWGECPVIKKTMALLKATAGQN